MRRVWGSCCFNFQENILIKPVRKIRCKYNLKDLVSKIPPTYKVQEESWGSPVGLEVCGKWLVMFPYGFGDCLSDYKY